MWRALIFIAILAAGAVAAVWLADQPGTVVVTFAGYEARTTVAVAAVTLVGVAFLLAVLWSAITGLVRLPGTWQARSRERRRARGYKAVSRGMVAVGAGDPLGARRHAAEAERLLGHEPLTLLLKAQAAQVSGNRVAAEAAFGRMIEGEETRVLGLRGLFVEARRRGDLEAAHRHAQEAARLAPAASWASDAVLEAHCAERDWRGARESVERRASLGLIDKAAARRQRAVLLTAEARDRQERDPDGALETALDALKLAPDLVPAAVLAGRLLSRRGDLRKAARAVETAWKIEPHPELAEVYLNLRPGDSALDRLARAHTLAKLSSWSPEARIAIARSAIEAREFGQAREALEPLLHDRPTVRVCLLMADLEQLEHGRAGHGREWVMRATRAPRDPAWIADGVISDHWEPISPVTGQLDAFRWQTPPDVLVAPELARLDEVTADLDEEEKFVSIPPAIPPAAAPAPIEEAATPATPVEAAPAEPEKPRAPEPAPASSPPVIADAPAPEPRAPEEKKPATVLVSPMPHPEAANEPGPESKSEAKPEAVEERKREEARAGEKAGTNGTAYAPAPVIFPIKPPDDPGPEEPERVRKGVFG
ncbi:heme biosynthesis protein HemY [Microvirga massiliensis]|uniref:heme biosynthesis protein HemY n=1 Tax=Microvirga massiliensis TaxID=1033741 RepID=UPI00062B452E|nr:heme biosynthesis HemY N-terminal domain-containing protein [Microvirga massiliensis]